MSDELVERVRALTTAFLETDLVRLRIEDEKEDAVELRRGSASSPSVEEPAGGAPQAEAPPANLEPVKADLVGIFHLTRPAVIAGEMLDGDRELAYVEALGIRNPVRSRGSGRIASVCCRDGQPVEYGQTLFEIDRG